jgi:hypothetical protein
VRCCMAPQRTGRVAETLATRGTHAVLRAQGRATLDEMGAAAAAAAAVAAAAARAKGGAPALTTSSSSSRSSLTSEQQQQQQWQQSQLSQLSQSPGEAAGGRGNAFSLCAYKCRAASGSVFHENSYRHPDQHYCFGEQRPPLTPGQSVNSDKSTAKEREANATSFRENANQALDPYVLPPRSPLVGKMARAEQQYLQRRDQERQQRELQQQKLRQRQKRSGGGGGGGALSSSSSSSSSSLAPLSLSSSPSSVFSFASSGYSFYDLGAAFGLGSLSAPTPPDVAPEELPQPPSPPNANGYGKNLRGGGGGGGGSKENQKKREQQQREQQGPPLVFPCRVPLCGAAVPRKYPN